MEDCQGMVFRNATIWAGSPIRKIQGTMRIRDSRIISIAGNGESAGDDSRCLDLAGRHIIPGLIDAHRHFFISALTARHGDASGWKSKADALEAIDEACRTDGSNNGWVFFSRMDYSTWKRPTPPGLREIDAAARGRPVFVTDITLHRALASTEAMRRAGLRREILRFSGDIDVRRNGEPKGTVWEEAHGRIMFTMYRDMLQGLSKEEKREMILQEAKRCLQMGITHVHDPGVPSDVQQQLDDARSHTPLKISWAVTSRGCLYNPPDSDDEAAAIHSPHAPKSVKFFLDGAHRTAADMPVVAGIKAMVRAVRESAVRMSTDPLKLLFEQKIVLKGGRLTLPYQRFADDRELLDRASLFADRGYRLVIHALGNIAALQAARLINTLKPSGGASVEHLLVMDERDLDVFAGCASVASIQPGFIPGYADTIERMGSLPYLKPFALQSMKKRGIPICISSDGPCGPDDPLFNARRAADRLKTDGSMLDPGEMISQEDALAAASIGGSLSMGIGNNGLCPGAPATFCVVDGDPFSDSSRVEQTWIDGVRVY